MERKKEIRKKIQEQLKRIDPETKLAKSKKAIANLISGMKVKTLNHIFCYVSKSDEVHTHAFIQCLLKNGKKVTLPRINPSNKMIEPKLISNWEKDLQPGTYGILEPKENLKSVAHLDTIDLFIVPGIAFDKRGYRLGRGKGHFDRFLAQIKDKTKITGLAWEAQLVETIPPKPHDIPMAHIVTETQLIEIKGK